jgi:hypothetical protein
MKSALAETERCPGRRMECAGGFCLLQIPEVAAKDHPKILNRKEPSFSKVVRTARFSKRCADR